MAKSRKQSVQTVTAVPGTPAEIKTVDPTPATPLIDTLASNAVAASIPAPTPPVDTPAPSNPPAPLPCEIVADAPEAEKLKAPDYNMTAKAFTIALRFCKTVGAAFIVATERAAEWGKIAESCLATEYGNSKDWKPTRFDSVMSDLGRLYLDVNPDSAAIRPANLWKAHRFLEHCKALGIVGAESIAYRTIVNALFPAAFTMVKEQATSTVRDGWADWLKTVVPLIVAGKLTYESVTASVEAQRAALHAFDSKKYAKPPVKKTSTPTPAPSTPAPSGSLTPANNASPTPAPTPANNANPTPAPSTSAPTATQTASAATLNLESFAKSLNAVVASALGDAIASQADDSTVMSLYRTLSPRLKMIRDKQAAQQAMASA